MPSEFEDWNRLPEFERWVETIADKHDLVQPNENNPQQNWSPNTTELVESVD